MKIASFTTVELNALLRILTGKKVKNIKESRKAYPVAIKKLKQASRRRPTPEHVASALGLDL